jgi:hypothetical protein
MAGGDGNGTFLGRTLPNDKNIGARRYRRV